MVEVFRAWGFTASGLNGSDFKGTQRLHIPGFRVKRLRV